MHSSARGARACRSRRTAPGAGEFHHGQHALARCHCTSDRLQAIRAVAIIMRSALLPRDLAGPALLLAVVIFHVRISTVRRMLFL